MHLGWFVDLNSTMLGRAGGFYGGESMERTIAVYDDMDGGPGRGRTEAEVGHLDRGRTERTVYADDRNRR
jgi:hypothetical protein